MASDEARSRPHSRTGSDAAIEPVHMEGWVWKKTAIADFVIRRYTRLYADKFRTFPKQENFEDYKTWRLDEQCLVQPAIAAQVQKRRRTVRPPNLRQKVTALAGLYSKGDPIDLYCFRVVTPNGNTSHFTFGFETFEAAAQWHSALSSVIRQLQVAAGVLPPPQLHSPASIHIPDRSDTPLGEPLPSMAGGPPSVLGYPTTPTGAAAGCVSSAAGAAAAAGVLLAATSSGTVKGMSAAAAREQIDRLLGGDSGTRAPRRWIPYKHSNGVAIYQRGNKQGTGEYMVSAVVNGNQLEVLRAMLDPASTTTILGPASEVEVLDSSTSRHVLRIRIAAAGPVGQVFRPREAIIERVFIEGEGGDYIFSFNSIAAYDARLQTAQEGVIEEAEGLASTTRRDTPVRCRVRGTYTISRLEAAAGLMDSQQTLVCCSLEMLDMGGWLHHAHPLFSWLDWWYGAYEAFLERMLMSVILVKDAVEQARFVTNPEKLRRDGCSSRAVQAARQASAGGPLSSQQDAMTLSGRSHSMDAFTKPAPFSRMASSRQGSVVGGIMFRNSSLPFAEGCGTPGASVTGGFARPGGGSAGGAAAAPAAAVAGEVGGVGSLPGALSLGGRLAAFEEAEQETPPEFHLDTKFYEELHTEGHDAPFKVRGARYLQDSRKVEAGLPVFRLEGIELLETKGAVHHISRYLEVVRHSQEAFLFVYNMIVPGSPTLSVVMVFSTDHHPDTLGPPPEDPDEGEWQPFDYAMSRFLQSSDEERRNMFKMIPHIAEGSWIIKQSVGSTPCLIGNKLQTEFAITDKYVEVSVDVGSSAAAAYITGLVRGATRALVIDIGLVLEGQHSYELPEELLGAIRVKRLDLGVAVQLDDSRELDIR